MKRPDGSLSLMPSALVTPDILELARDAKPEIEAVVSTLPKPGLCPICGAPNGWAEIDGSITAHCVTCALIGADRVLTSLGIESQDISMKEASHAA